MAVTAGYIGVEARREFYAKMDAANVDLKGFTDEFYVKLCGARLQPVLDTLVYLVHETDVWTEITTLLIPGKTGMDRGKLSVASVAVDVARAVFDTFADKTVLVIGAGKMGDLTLQHLKGLNPGQILVLLSSGL